VHPDDLPAAAATWAQALASGTVYETEFRIRRADGSFRWFLVRAEPVRGTDGAILNWVGTNTDIDDRRRADAELRELNETLEAQVEERTAKLRLHENIVQSDRSLIVAFDHDYRVTVFNQAHGDEFFRVFGHRAQLGEVLPDLFPPDQAAVLRGFLDRALAGESFTVVEEFGDPGLAKPTFEVSYYPLRTRPAASLAPSTTPATSRTACARKPTSQRPRKPCANRRRWRPWANSRVVWRTTSTTC
jgi:PAS domain-containing protein